MAITVNFLESVADLMQGLLGPAIGALIALIGVGIQLRHNRQERQTDREWEQRRHVYLHAAEGVARNAQFLSSIANPSISEEDARAQLNEVAGWLNKVHTVASIETIEALKRADEHFLVAIAEASKLKFSTQSLDIRLTSSAQEAQRAEASLQQVDRAFQTLASNGQLTSESADQLRAQANTQRELLASLHAQQAELLKEKQRLGAELTEAATKNALEYLRQLAPVNLCIRREMNLPLDEDRYLRTVRESTIRAESAFEDLINHIKSEIAKAG